MSRRRGANSWVHSGTTARVGRKLSADVRRQAHAGIGRDRPHRKARRRCLASVRGGQSIRRARTASFKTKGWPTNWLRNTTWRAVSKRAGYAYLRNARNCYDRWGAHGKVKQLDERYPRLREERTSASSATIGPPVGQLDVETVVKASQALSREIVLPGLIEKLVRIAVENAGAERGLLILMRGGEPRIEAEATTGRAGSRLRFDRQRSRRLIFLNPR